MQVRFDANHLVKNPTGSFLTPEARLALALSLALTLAGDDPGLRP